MRHRPRHWRGLPRNMRRIPRLRRPLPPHWQLVIVGEGPEELAIHNEAERLGIETYGDSTEVEAL